MRDHREHRGGLRSRDHLGRPRVRAPRCLRERTGRGGRADCPVVSGGTAARGLRGLPGRVRGPRHPFCCSAVAGLDTGRLALGGLRLLPDRLAGHLHRALPAARRADLHLAGLHSHDRRRARLLGRLLGHAAGLVPERKPDAGARLARRGPRGRGRRRCGWHPLARQVPGGIRQSARARGHHYRDRLADPSRCVQRRARASSSSTWVASPTSR